MVDREDIPQSIDLENTERAPVGDDPNVRFEEDDFSGETFRKIGDYFREEITNGNKESAAAIQDQPGTDDISSLGPNSSNDFLAKRSDTERAGFEQISNSGLFNKDTVPGNAGEVDSETEIQASKLLELIRDVPQNLAGEVSVKIEQNALHGPDNEFVTNDSPPEDVAGTRRHVVQSQFGEHSPQRLFTGPGQGPADPSVTIQNLKNLGCQILLEACGEINVPDNPNDIAEILGARATATVVPGVARLGFRVDANRFGAMQILNNVNSDIIKPSVDIDLEGPAKPTYGSVNNPLVPFSAISSGASSVIAGTLLVLTFSGIFTALSAIFNGANELRDLPAPLDQQISVAEKRKRTLGSYFPKDPTSSDPNFGTAVATFFGVQEDLLVPTQFEYVNCVQEGLALFFGINTSDLLGSTGGSALRIIETPGYYTGLLRMLVRSVTDPLAAVAGNLEGLGVPSAGPSFTVGPADYDPLIGPANDPTAFLESAKLIKESRFLKFMNVLANLGDVSLATRNRTEDESTIDNVPDAIPGDIRFDGSRVRVPDPAALQQRSRLSDRLDARFDNSLAWGADTLPSLYMINSEIQQAEGLFAQSMQYVGLASRRNFATTTNTRLPREFVDDMEKRLDTYYMPFYFHDLRTNEIVAFHAFLDNITDSHTADYNESEGYGRIGKIYTYKNTTRSINLSFKVVAVNQRDFDAMWYKLNKILMMLYPQYTLGRVIEANSQKFVQPFSQLPSASPMIRLRVGDLIKTNFSEFDLARLFGIGSPQFNVSQERAERLSEATRNFIRDEIGRISRRHEAANFQPGEFFRFGIAVRQIASRQTRGNTFLKRTTDRFQGVSAARAREVRRQENNRRNGGQPDVPVNQRAVVNGPVPGKPMAYSITFSPPLTGEQQGTSYEVDFNALDQNISPANAIRLDQDSIRSAAELAAQQQRPQIASELEIRDQQSADVVAFFNPNSDGGMSRGATPSQQQANAGGTNNANGNAQSTVGGNPIFKSFESTRGKGLAGFIKSLNFNWEGALWETKAANSKAPQWCTIEMEFAPVHDLNPGIDVNGNMIAPIYNVGEILQQMKIRRAGRVEEDTRTNSEASSQSRTNPGNNLTPTDEL